MCLGQGADLRMVQLMSLPLTISCSSKSRLVLPLWLYISRASSPRKSKRAVCVCVLAPNIGVLRKFDPLIGEQCQQNSKRHTFAWVCINLAIVYKNLSMCLTCRRVPPKGGINLKNCYILHVCISPLWMGLHPFISEVGGHRRNHLWQFFGSWLRGVDFVRGQNLLFSIGMSSHH